MHLFVLQRLQKCFGFRGRCPLTPTRGSAPSTPAGGSAPGPLAPRFFELFRTLSCNVYRC